VIVSGAVGFLGKTCEFGSTNVKVGVREMGKRFLAVIVGALFGMALQQIFAWLAGGNCSS